MAEASQHGFSLDYIDFGYFVVKVVFVLECRASAWVLVPAVGQVIPSFLCSWIINLVLCWALGYIGERDLHRACS